MLQGPLLTSGLPIGPTPEPPSSEPGSGDGTQDAKAVDRITSVGDVKLAQNPGESSFEHQNCYLQC
jgi:hypothetical protein